MHNEEDHWRRATESFENIQQNDTYHIGRTVPVAMKYIYTQQKHITNLLFSHNKAIGAPVHPQRRGPALLAQLVRPIEILDHQSLLPRQRDLVEVRLDLLLAHARISGTNHSAGHDAHAVGQGVNQALQDVAAHHQRQVGDLPRGHVAAVDGALLKCGLDDGLE